MEKQRIEVCCAVLEEKGKILAVKRGPGGKAGEKWEFPGGKKEEGESSEECIQREILEELHLEITIIKVLDPVEVEHENEVLVLLPFLCRKKSGELQLTEHTEFKWDYPENLMDLDWAAPDLPILMELDL